jgi:hypothetical protein
MFYEENHLLTYAFANSQLGGEYELKHLRYPHEWIELKDLHEGQVFWAALKHPYYKHVTNRLYLVVSTAQEKIDGVNKRVAVAVVSLESNGGLGKSRYGPNEQAYLRGIKVQNTEVNYNNEEGPSHFEEYQRKLDDTDDANWYIMDWSTKDWEPQPNTIVDITTVLLIAGEKLLCRKCGKLSLQSWTKIRFAYGHMDPETRAYAMTRPTPKIPLNPDDVRPGVMRTRYRANINPISSIYNPNDKRFLNLCPIELDDL